jgi:hypothetical protein
MSAYDSILKKCKGIRVSLKYKVEEIAEAAALESIIELGNFKFM